jgi:hypothetical protein
MDDKQLTHVLNRIAEKEIGNDMDKLTEIRASILNRRQARLPLRMAAALATLLAVVFTSVAVYALVQNDGGDPGLTAVDEAGLVTELNLSQTIDDVTVTISRGYADANRVALWFRADGIDPDEAGLWFDSTLLDAATGEWFGTGGQSNILLDEGTDEETGVPYTEGILTFSHAEAVDAGATFDLTLEFDLIPAPRGQVDGAWPEPVATFTFEFSLSVIEALELEPDATVSANGIDMTLQSLRISPSATSMQLCYNTPDAQDWQPVPELTIGEDEGLASSMGIVMPFDPQSLYRCMNVDFLIAYIADETDETPPTLTVSIPRLQTSIPEPTPDKLEAAAAILAEQGIDVEFILEGRALGWEILAAPEGLTEPEIGLMIWDAMREHYAGPWTFEVNLETGDVMP